jgi:hypothetical protein
LSRSLYNILSNIGFIPENCIGRDSIDIAVNKRNGLCLLYRGLCLSRQRKTDKNSVNGTINIIRKSTDAASLKELYMSNDIDYFRYVHKFPLTGEMLTLSPDEILETIINMLVLGKQSNITIIKDIDIDNI